MELKESGWPNFIPQSRESDEYGGPGFLPLPEISPECVFRSSETDGMWYFAYGSNLQFRAVTEWCRHYGHRPPVAEDRQARHPG